MNSDLFLAVGQANGRIMLTSFGPSEFDGVGLTGRELGKSLINETLIVLKS